METAEQPWDNRPPDDPAQLTDLHLLAFRAYLEQVRGLAAGTVIKLLAALRSLLRTLGPRETGNPHGLGLIALVPACRFPRQPQRPVQVLEDNELDSLYAAAKLQTWPRAPSDQGALAEAAWRGSLVLCTCHGFRTGELVQLRTDLVRLDPASPMPHASGLVSPWGWIRVVAPKTGKGYWLPLLRTTRGHLDRLEALRRRWPDRFTIDQPQRDRIQELHGITLAAGVQWILPFRGHYQGGAWERHVKAWRRAAKVPAFSPKILRKTCSTRWSSISNDNLGAWVCGHDQKGVNEKHYQTRDQILLDRGPDFPLPCSFHRWRQWDRQLPLF